MTNTASFKPESIDHIAKVSGRYARTAKLNSLMSDVVSDILDPSTITHDALLEVQAVARRRPSSASSQELMAERLRVTRAVFAEALLTAFDAWALDTGVELEFDDRMWMLTSILHDFGFPPDVALSFSASRPVHP